MATFNDLCVEFLKELENLRKLVIAERIKNEIQRNENSNEIDEAILGEEKLEMSFEDPKEVDNEEEEEKEENKHEPSLPMPPLEGCGKEENESESTIPIVPSKGFEEGLHEDKEKGVEEKEVTTTIEEIEPLTKGENNMEPGDENQQGGDGDRIESINKEISSLESKEHKESDVHKEITP